MKSILKYTCATILAVLALPAIVLASIFIGIFVVISYIAELLDEIM